MYWTAKLIISDGSHNIFLFYLVANIDGSFCGSSNVGVERDRDPTGLDAVLFEICGGILVGIQSESLVQSFDRYFTSFARWVRIAK